LLLVGGVVFWLLRQIGVRSYTPERWWILALVSVLAIHSMLEYPMWYAYFLGIAAILLGIGETRCFRLNMQQAGRKLFVLLMVLGVMSLFNLVQSYSGFEGAFYGLGKNLSKKSDLESNDDDAKELLKQVMSIHRESLLSSYAEIAISRTIVLNSENLANKLAVNGRAMHAAPINEIVYRQAILLGLNGEHQLAARQFDLAAAAYPRDVAAVILVIERKLQREGGGSQGLQALLKHAVSWREAHPSANEKNALVGVENSRIAVASAMQNR